MNIKEKNEFGKKFEENSKPAWDLSEVKDMSAMFKDAKQFERSIEDKINNELNVEIMKLIKHNTFMDYLQSALEKKQLISISLINSVISSGEALDIVKNKLNDDNSKNLIKKGLGENLIKDSLKDFFIVKNLESPNILNELKLKAADYNLIMLNDKYETNKEAYEKAIIGKTEAEISKITESFSNLNKELANLSEKNDDLKSNLLEEMKDKSSSSIEYTFSDM